MASWGKNRSGRHLSIAVPPEIKIQLIKNKATHWGRHRVSDLRSTSSQVGHPERSTGCSTQPRTRNSQQG